MTTLRFLIFAPAMGIVFGALGALAEPIVSDDASTVELLAQGGFTADPDYPDELFGPRGSAQVAPPPSGFVETDQFSETVGFGETDQFGGGIVTLGPDIMVVAEAQSLLAQLGLDPGLPDGVAGVQTVNAAREFQMQYSLPTTGIIDQTLVDQLRVAVQSRTGGADPANSIVAMAPGAPFGPGIVGPGIVAPGFLQTGPAIPSLLQTAVQPVQYIPAMLVSNQVPGVGYVPPHFVQETQIYLTGLGFGPGAPDGIIGHSTIQAIIAFQARTEMAQDGRLTPHLLHALRQMHGTTGVQYPQQRVAIARREVYEIQRILTYLGFDAGPVDGMYGPDTGRAIWAYQREVGLPIDGWVSPEILASLQETYRLELLERQPIDRFPRSPLPGPALVGPFSPLLYGGPPIVGAPLIGAPVAVVPVPLIPLTAVGGGSLTGLPGALVFADPHAAHMAPGTMRPPHQADGALPLQGGIVPQPTGQRFGFAGTLPPRQAGPQAIINAAAAAAPMQTAAAVQLGRMPDGAPIPLASPPDAVLVEPIQPISPNPAVGPAPTASSEPAVREEVVLGEAVTLRDLIASNRPADAGSEPESSSSTTDGIAVIDPARIVEVAGYTPGLVLETFQLSSNGDREFLGKIFDTSPLPFGYDAFLGADGIDGYSTEGPILLEWSGALSILETGEHRVRLESVLTQAVICDVELFIDETLVLQLQPSQPGTERNDTIRVLTQGPVAFRLTLACMQPLTNAQAYVDVRVSGPSEEAEPPLADGRIFAKNPFL